MGPVLNSLVLYITVLLLKIVNADRPIITTELGQLEGVWQTSAKGLKYAAFLGIPYAKPPIDDLRFEVQTASFFLCCVNLIFVLNSHQRK